MNNRVVVAAVALASAGLASVCCIGPLVLTGLGLGSLGLAAGLTQYRPLFLALTGLVLASGFYLADRKRPAACADGSCELRSGSRAVKVALWAITALTVAVATFPNWSVRVLNGGSAAAPAGAEMISLRVSGMDCAACTAAIKKSVEKVPGVYSASVDFDSQRATVATDGKADPQAVLKAVAAAGYKAEPLRTAIGDDATFCLNPACEVVYCNPGGFVVRKGQTALSVTIKDLGDHVPVCYCFDFKRGDLRNDLEERGKTDIPERIRKGIAEGRCACERTNPQGACCLGNIAGAIKQIQEEVKSHG